jgi:opacity protein-like surface antigen
VEFLNLSAIILFKDLTGRTEKFTFKAFLRREKTMKKILLLSFLTVFVFASSSVYAANTYALGNSGLAVKVDYISFTDDVFDKLDLKDGVYVGLESYLMTTPNLYFGLESGWAGSKNDGSANALGGSFDTETKINYVPIELNLKYAVPVSPAWTIALGAGISYNWFEVELDVDGKDKEISDWVLGGQVFADITYKMNNQWFIGINGKYQFTEKLNFETQVGDMDSNASADNYRVGVHIGVMF